MIYRKLGKTGMSASVIGLGTEHLDNKPFEIVDEVIHTAMDQEINIMDLFMPGAEVRENIGKALDKNRDKFIIQGHFGSVDLNKQYDISRDPIVCQKYFDDLLLHLNTDYIDIGMLFYIDSEKDFNSVFHTDFVNHVIKMKEQGKVRAIGASSHNPIYAKKAVETGILDVLMFSINPAFDMTPPGEDCLGFFLESENGRPAGAVTNIDPARMDLYRLCEKNDIAITVMKTLGAGKLISPEHTPFQSPLTVWQCIHYALTRPAVTSVMLGCKSGHEVLEAIKYLTLSDNERDYSQTVSTFSSDFRGKCMYCNHCLPCPADIDIAAVTKFLDIALLDKNNIPPSIRQHYQALTTHASDCIACGSCESRCPFSVNIIDNMMLAQTIF